MPFAFSERATRALPANLRSIEDRRDNPVPGRRTKFRLLQQNMLAYTFPFIPGFGPSAVNSMPFSQVVERPIQNALAEGELLFGVDFDVASNAVAKVTGDVFELVEGAVHWNAAAWWNLHMRGGSWPSSPRYARPRTRPDATRQVAALALPRNYDWVRLLDEPGMEVVSELRRELAEHDLSLPTSTPDLLLVGLPEHLRQSEIYASPLPDLGLESQQVLRSAHECFEGAVPADGFILAVALKKSLRSDRLYQPLYEANNMQLILEGRLGGDQLDFEVHSLESAGTGAINTYKAASLANVVAGEAQPHRAVRELYEPANAAELVRRLFEFLDTRL